MFGVSHRLRYPPGRLCVICHGNGGESWVDDPASITPYAIGRVPCVPYVVNRQLSITPVLVVPCWGQ